MERFVSVGHKSREEAYDPVNIGAFSLAHRLGDTTPDKHPQRSLHPIGSKLLLVFFKDAKLLVKGEQGSGEIEMLGVSFTLGQVENLVILAVPISVKVAIGVIKQNCPGILLG